MNARRVMPTAEEVYAVVREYEPVTVEKVREHLGLPWESRQTVRNRLYDLEREGRIISNDERPMAFAINLLSEVTQ